LFAEFAAQQKRSEQIHIHDATPLRRREIFGADDLADTGVVHQNIGTVKMFAYVGGCRDYESFVCDITRETDRAMARVSQFLYDRVERLLIEQSEIVACLGEHARDYATEPLRCACDYGDAF